MPTPLPDHSSSFARPPRSPWGKFPPVLRNADIGTLKREPEYLDAKAGDARAALDMADRIITAEFVESIRNMGGAHPNPVLLPVLAEESAGRNKIPEMFARTLAYRSGWSVERNIVQITRAFHTDSGADHRLVIHPEFAGEIDPQAGYILFDDTLTMGGTLAGLRGFVLYGGGQVLGAAVAVAHEGALNLTIRPQMVENIHRKHGIEASEDFAHEQWGYGLDCLTQGEAGHIYKAVSLDALRDRFAAARNEHGRRLGASRTEAPLSERLEGFAHGRIAPSRDDPSEVIATNHFTKPSEGPDDIVRPGLSVSKNMTLDGSGIVPTAIPLREGIKDREADQIDRVRIADLKIYLACNIVGALRNIPDGVQGEAMVNSALLRVQETVNNRLFGPSAEKSPLSEDRVQEMQRQVSDAFERGLPGVGKYFEHAFKDVLQEVTKEIKNALSNIRRENDINPSL